MIAVWHKIFSPLLKFIGSLFVKKIVANEIDYLLVFLLVGTLAAKAQVKLGQKAPNIVLPAMNGDSVSLGDLKGKVVLVDFWASWCGPCRQNNPYLVKLYSRYQDKGFEILSVSIDKKSADWKKAVNTDNLKWIQVIDDKGWEASTTMVYGVDAIPRRS
jgi:thiol-disulfide isomerase/thioredoxin